ncbi:ribonuclease H-like domain-containing protein [Tanacetum coccineum]
MGVLHVTSNNTTVDPQSNNFNSNATSKSPVSLSNEQLTRLMNLLNENGVSFANANMSGANQHMTVSAKFLINVVAISNLGLIVGHPNGTQAYITKIGDLKLNNNITLYDVLVVPEYTVSLLSVHELSRDNKLTLWHQRLGHPVDPVLDVLKGFLNLDSQTISEHLCDTCNKAKQTREPFPLSEHKSSKIGELVHLDVWGTYKVTSRDGFRYFFTIVDDFTRAVWIYMLKGMDDFYDSILSLNNNNQGNDDSDATSMEETNNTHPEGNSQNETDFINDFDDLEINSDTEELPVNNLRRFSRETKLPSSLNDFIVEEKVKYGVERVVNYANLKSDSLCFATALNKSIEPTCYKEVVLDSNWIDAMNSKIEALNDNQTWVITDLPPGRKAIGNKWIYKIKYKSSGDIDIYKARLVVKGCSQKEGVDFDETFSPVVKMSYIYDNPFECKENNDRVCKLVKSLYGLKQAPRKWNEKLVTGLKEHGFIQSINDHSLFTKTKGNKFIALLVYVDDIVVTGNCVNEINKFKVFLKSIFKIKHLGSMKFFLGIEVIGSDKDLCLTQRKYCLELLKDYGLLGCKPVSTPMVPNSVLSYKPTDDDPLLDNITGYQKLLGKLIYLTHTRPDIAYSVHCLAQHMHSPLKSHLNSALNVLRYLKGAHDLYCDNKSALQLATNSVFHERSKHFEIDVHYIREKITKGMLNTKKISASHQIADNLTKHLPRWRRHGNGGGRRLWLMMVVEVACGGGEVMAVATDPGITYLMDGGGQTSDRQDFQRTGGDESIKKCSISTKMYDRTRDKMQINKLEMMDQIKHGKAKTFDIISKLCHIEQLLIELPASKTKRAQIEASFPRLCTEADIVMNAIMNSMNIQSDEKQMQLLLKMLSLSHQMQL